MISYNYTNTVLDPNAKGKLKNYDTVMSIPEDSLIKPESLKGSYWRSPHVLQSLWRCCLGNSDRC